MARKTIADIFSIANEEPLPGMTTREFLKAWMKRKEIEAGDTIHLRYAGVVQQFLS